MRGKGGENRCLRSAAPSHMPQLAGKLVTERRKFQLGVCEVSGDCSPDRLGMRLEKYQLLFSAVYVPQYMLKVNDVKTKRGVDFAEHLVGYYQAQETYAIVVIP